MDQTNYYFHMKTLEELRRKRDDLLQQKKQKKLTERLKSLQTANETLTTDITSISNLMRTFAEDNNNSLLKDDANYIQLNVEAAQDLRETVTAVKEIISCKLEKASLDFDRDDIKEFVDSLRRKNAEFNRVQNNCTTLIKNIQRIKNGGTTEMSPGETLGVLSSNKKQRERRSMLSESSFMQTFQCMNVSSSSPIHTNRSRRNPHNKENTAANVIM